MQHDEASVASLALDRPGIQRRFRSRAPAGAHRSAHASCLDRTGGNKSRRSSPRRFHSRASWGGWRMELGFRLRSVEVLRIRGGRLLLSSPFPGEHDFQRAQSRCHDDHGSCSHLRVSSLRSLHAHDGQASPDLSRWGYFGFRGSFSGGSGSFHCRSDSGSRHRLRISRIRGFRVSSYRLRAIHPRIGHARTAVVGPEFWVRILRHGCMEHAAGFARRYRLAAA